MANFSSSILTSYTAPNGTGRGELVGIAGVGRVQWYVCIVVGF